MADEKDAAQERLPLLEDPIVARLKSAAGEMPAGLTSYVGLLGRSAKEGHWLLYPGLDMRTCIEIQESDIVHSEQLSADRSPFGGLGGTRVFVKKGAQVTTTRTVSRTHQAGAGDEFDLDIRVGRARSLSGRVVPFAECDSGNSVCPGPGTDGCPAPSDGCPVPTAGCPRDTQPACPNPTDPGVCAPSNAQFQSCNTCPVAVCTDTCGGFTCVGTCQQNCQTQTCQTGCPQDTCQTCHTNCGTCPTCTCQTCGGGTCTCAACSHATCFQSCNCP